MAKSPFKKVAFYYRSKNTEALLWEKKIQRWIKKRCPQIIFPASNELPRIKRNAPNLLIVLGGDGTILEAAQKFQCWNPLILGMNLGHVGFLASIREKKNFLEGLSKIFRKKYRAIPRMLIKGEVLRKGKKIFSTYALNDIAVHSLLGIVDIDVYVDGHLLQFIHGTGVMISTATGSTAFNLSAHGPIVTPDIKCLIITELMDHNIPTPSLVIKRNRIIALKIEDFRKKEQFILKETGETADVVLSADTGKVVVLERGDRVIIKKSENLIRFAELEKNYFFKSLQEKFAFK